jgi:uncharacterized membrane protein
MFVLVGVILGAVTGLAGVWVGVLAIRPPRRARADTGTRLICVGGSATFFAFAIEAVFPYWRASHGTRVLSFAILIALVAVGQVFIQVGIRVRARRSRREAASRTQAAEPDISRG